MTLSESIAILKCSPRGKNALRGLEAFLPDHASSLDKSGAAALVELVRRYVGDYPGSTLESIQNALEP